MSGNDPKWTGIGQEIAVHRQVLELALHPLVLTLLSWVLMELVLVLTVVPWCF